MDPGVWLGLEEGVPVVGRRVGPDGREGLRRTAAQLERASHPGVVRVVASRASGDGWELVTEHGGLPVAAAAWTSPVDVAALGAAVAATLADLHDQGVVHGRLDARRILIGRQGQPVLCGLAPPAGPGEIDALPADDVAALGRVLRALLAPMGATGPSARATLASLGSVLDATEADPPSRRPTARRLAAELGSHVPGPPVRPPARVAGRPAAVARRRVGGGAALAGLVTVTVALVVGIAFGLRPAARGAPGPRAAGDRSAVATTVVPGCVATEGTPIAAGACGHAVRVEGPAVVVDGQRYVVGIDGDEVAVADWDCAGALRAAVLRPTTGEVRVFAPFTPDRRLSVVRAERPEPTAASLAIGVRGGCPTIGGLGGTDAGPSDPRSKGAEGHNAGVRSGHGIVTFRRC